MQGCLVFLFNNITISYNILTVSNCKDMAVTVLVVDCTFICYICMYLFLEINCDLL